MMETVLPVDGVVKPAGVWMVRTVLPDAMVIGDIFVPGAPALTTTV